MRSRRELFKTGLTALLGATVGAVALSAPAEAKTKAEKVMSYCWSKVNDADTVGQDCSLFAQRAFRAAGVSLPRTTGQQVRVGRSVSYSSAKRGDLIFFYGGGHVAVYAGNGRVYHDPGTRRRVNMEQVRYLGRIHAVRRIV